MTLWSPADHASGLAHWYDAADGSTIVESGGAVTDWADKSGAGRHLGQANAGRRGVRSANAHFGGLPTIAFPVGGGMVCASGAVDDVQYWTNGASLAVNAYATPATFPMNVVLSAGWSGSGDVVIRRDGAQIAASGGAMTPAAAAVVFAVLRIRSSGQSSTQSRILDQYSSSAFVLGNRDTDWARTADMDFAELIIVEGAPSAGEIETFEGYLAWKWSLAAQLAAGHAFADAAPTTGGESLAVTGAATGVAAASGAVSAGRPLHGTVSGAGASSATLRRRTALSGGSFGAASAMLRLGGGGGWSRTPPAVAVWSPAAAVVADWMRGVQTPAEWR
jgi:hypothetical protein